MRHSILFCPSGYSSLGVRETVREFEQQGQTVGERVMLARVVGVTGG